MSNLPTNTPRVQSRDGNVVELFPRKTSRPAASAFDALTAALILERHRRGQLDEAIVVALLGAVGLEASDGP
jgi:hypothetical protein